MATTMRTAGDLRTLTPDPHEVEYRTSTTEPGHASLTQLVRLGIVLGGHLDRIATALEEEAAIAESALERRRAGPHAQLRDRLANAIHQARAERSATVTLGIADAVLIEIALGRAAQ